MTDKDRTRIDGAVSAIPPTHPNRSAMEQVAEVVVQNRPNASLAELKTLVRMKMADFDDMVRLFDSLRPKMAETTAEISAALSNGSLAEVDEILAAAEKDCLERKPEDGQTLAWLCFVRARNALLAGCVSEAVKHFAAAAHHVEEDNAEDAAQYRRTALFELRRHGLAFGGDWFEAALEFCEANLQHWKREQSPWEWAATQMNIGVVKMAAGDAKTGTEAIYLFLEAEVAFRYASWEFTLERHQLDWAATQNNSGLAVAKYCFRDGTRLNSWISAENYYRCALLIRTRDEQPTAWAETMTNLGYLWLHRGRHKEDTEGIHHLKEAIGACREAQEIHDRDLHAMDWATTQLIVADAFEAIGDQSSQNAANSYCDALTALSSALEVFKSCDAFDKIEEVEVSQRRIGDKLACGPKGA